QSVRQSCLGAKSRPQKSGAQHNTVQEKSAPRQNLWVTESAFCKTMTGDSGAPRPISEKMKLRHKQLHRRERDADPDYSKPSAEVQVICLCWRSLGRQQRSSPSGDRGGGEA